MDYYLVTIQLLSIYSAGIIVYVMVALDTPGYVAQIQSHYDEYQRKLFNTYEDRIRKSIKAVDKQEEDQFFADVKRMSRAGSVYIFILCSAIKWPKHISALVTHFTK